MSIDAAPFARNEVRPSGDPQAVFRVDHRIMVGLAVSAERSRNFEVIIAVDPGREYLVSEFDARSRSTVQ